MTCTIAMAQPATQNANLSTLWPIHQKVWEDIESIVDTKVWIGDQGPSQREMHGTQIRGKAGDGVEEVVIYIPRRYTYMVDIFLRKMSFCKVVSRIGHEVKPATTEPARTNLQIALDGADRNVFYIQAVWIQFIAEVEETFYPTRNTMGPLTNQALATGFNSPTMNQWFQQEYYMDRHDPHGLQMRQHLVDHSVNPHTLSTLFRHLCTLVCISLALTQKWTHRRTKSRGLTKRYLRRRHADPYTRCSTPSMRRRPINYRYDIANVHKIITTNNEASTRQHPLVRPVGRGRTTTMTKADRPPVRM
jgi:hypothetical protein